ncbi:MAG: ANTAR domain-containing protein [Alphaproteobacteria bacterium]|nr:ANTAR domain-containing protein [Alphaproteobacteria bacterium]
MKVLLADDDAKPAHRLAGALETDTGLVVARLEAGETLAEAVAAHAPDVVIFGIGRPECGVLEGVRQLASRSPCPVVLFVDEDDPGFMEEAIGAGVSSYNVLASPPCDVKPILRAAVALFQQHRGLREELDRAERKLGEREVIDRAKAILMRERRLAEPAAYAWLRRTAMARGKRIVEIAEEITRERPVTARS